MIRSAMDQSHKVSSPRIELRKHPRCAVRPSCLLSFAPFAPTLSFGGDVDGEGVVLNLSQCGCKINSEAGVQVGDAMSLIVLLPGEICPTMIDLALVRWENDKCFGVEFVAMGTGEFKRICQFLASSAPE